MKTLKTALTALITLLTTTVLAQDYKTGVGVRLGWDSGITAKHFVSGQDALEGILSTRWRGFQFTGLYERHFPLFNEAGLKGYVGGGGHIGSYYGRYYRHYHFHEDHRYYDSYFVNIGVDGILGIEYTFANAPINLGLDIRPGMDLVYLSPVYIGGAFSIRYAIK